MTIDTLTPPIILPILIPILKTAKATRVNRTNPKATSYPVATIITVNLAKVNLAKVTSIQVANLLVVSLPFLIAEEFTKVDELKLNRNMKHTYTISIYAHLIIYSLT